MDEHVGVFLLYLIDRKIEDMVIFYLLVYQRVAESVNWMAGVVIPHFPMHPCRYLAPCWEQPCFLWGHKKTNQLKTFCKMHHGDIYGMRNETS